MSQQTETPEAFRIRIEAKMESGFTQSLLDLMPMHVLLAQVRSHEADEGFVDKLIDLTKHHYNKGFVNGVIATRAEIKRTLENAHGG